MKANIFSTKTLIFFIALTPFILSSCYVETGYDGRPGDAYLSLQWETDAPSYLDAGTSDIPAHFEYGRFYYAQPGFYNLYYEGEMWDGYGMAYYGWDIDYEIWRNAGSQGGPGYNGYDGQDTHLTIILSPYGPFTDRWNKSASIDKNFEIIESGDDKVVIESVASEYGIRITYKKRTKTSI